MSGKGSKSNSNNGGERGSDYSIYKEWGGTHQFMASHGIKYGDYDEAKVYAEAYRQAGEQQAAEDNYSSNSKK